MNESLFYAHLLVVFLNFLSMSVSIYSRRFFLNFLSVSIRERSRRFSKFSLSVSIRECSRRLFSRTLERKRKCMNKIQRRRIRHTLKRWIRQSLSLSIIYQKAILRFQNLMDIYISIYISVSYFLEFLFEEIRDAQTKVCDMLQQRREKI